MKLMQMARRYVLRHRYAEGAGNWPVAQSSAFAGDADRNIFNRRAALASLAPAEAEWELDQMIAAALGMFGQPNLAELRRLPHMAPSRPLARRTTQQVARRDPEFRKIASRADRARDARSWQAGVLGYEQALALYPFHSAYIVQRGHCHKELGHFLLAEIDYRDGIALGAPVSDVRPHLEFVHARSPGSLRLYTAELLAQFEQVVPGEGIGRDDLATSGDLRSLARLFLGNSQPEPPWIARTLRRAPLRSSLARMLLADPAFYPANRHLVALNGRNPLA